MTKRRSYRQFCGLAQALDVVGERWSLLLVRNLLLGPLRYNDLLKGLPGITTNLLAKRLKELSASGVVEKRKGEGYALTDRGRALEPALAALGAWGSVLLREPTEADHHRSLAWLLVSLKRRYRGGADLSVSLVTPSESFALILAPTSISVERGDVRDPDLMLKGDEEAIVASLGLGTVDHVELTGGEGLFQSFQVALGLPLFA